MAVRESRFMATTFVGRAPELAEVHRLVRRARLVTLSGAAGVGKTRLARRVIDEAREIPVDLTVMVDLEPLGEPAALPGAVARSLGIADDPDRTAAEWVSELSAWFGRREVLLVLDTCDRLVDAAAGLATALLRAVPNLRVLATCRQSLGVPGEHVYVVHPMAADDAVALLRERLGRPADFDAAEAARLCGLLDGIPLAVELAAVSLTGSLIGSLGGSLGGPPAGRPIRELVAELGTGWDLPIGPAERELSDLSDLSGSSGSSGSPGVPERHRSLRAAIGWSHGLCSPRERLLWARMSVFPGDFDLRAAETVCGGGCLPATAVLDAIVGLIDKSLLMRRYHPDGTRYHALRAVRGFGAEWLDRLGERDEIHRRHDDYLKWQFGRGER